MSPKRPQLRYARPFDPANLRTLIARFHDGNVTDAARRLGLQQSTLHNLLQPGTAPMAETVELIAHTYRVTMDWVYGRESAKAADDTFAAGVLHAVSTIQATLEQLNATKDLAHLRTVLDATARFSLGSPPSPGPPSSVTRQVKTLARAQRDYTAEKVPHERIRRVAEPTPAEVQRAARKRKPKKRNA